MAQVADEYQLAMIGSGGVGKSSLVKQLVDNVFCIGYNPIIEEDFRKQAKVDERTCFLHIFDPVGPMHERLRDYKELRNIDGFLCVYSIVWKNSLPELNEYVEYILRTKDTEALPMVLCGNKCDLESERTVTKEEALQFGMSKMRLCESQIFEVSAKNAINVEESFYELVRTMRNNVVQPS